MPEDDTANNNLFLRFKQHVDQRVNVGLQSILGLPSVVSRTFAAGPPAAEDTEHTPSSPPMLGQGNWPRPSGEENAKPAMNQLQMAEESKDHIESTIDSFRGGSEEEGAMGLKLFLSRSPYSPLLLDRYLGWKPTPRDALDPQQGQHDDQYLGGWIDAFQDLLRVSSGLPMLDPSELQTRNRAAKELFAHTGGALKDNITQLATFWVWGLGQSRLDEVLFPYHDPEASYRSPRTMAEWVDLRRAERSAFEQLRGLAEAFRQGEEVWRKEVAPRIERIHAAAMDESETEEDAYQAVDRQTDAPKKWDDLFGFLKRIGEDEDKSQEARLISSSENTKPTWSGGTKTVTKKEWVDDAGAVHTEAVVSVKNKEGEETSRRVNHSIRSDENTQQCRSKPNVHIPNEDGSDGRADIALAKDDKKPTGWFWSRE
jgi:hypothetical protein